MATSSTAPMEVVDDAVVVVSHGAELPAGRQPAVASRQHFEVTTRDRLFVQLAKLPPRFHEEVARAFGGQSLLELTAASLAARLLDSETPVRQLRDAGYPAHLVEMVKRLMETHGVSGTRGA